MNDRPRDEALQRGDFRLAGWLVQPSLNRISRGSTIAQLEPKMIDVLLALAGDAGTVISKDALIEKVWKKQFISEWVLTRAIAKLRSAFGDDARHPRLIETISKRGYRLLVSPEPAEDGESEMLRRPAGTAGTASPAGRRRHGAAAPEPPSFLGRTTQIDEVLRGPRSALWVLGTRGIGKTSLLRHLEHLTSGGSGTGFFPLYWDLQGAAEPVELHHDFAEAVRDAGARLEAFGVHLADVIDDDLFVILGRLRRRLAAAGVTLLVLCDEVEELIQLREQDPALLRKLRRALQSSGEIRSVLASSPRLWALASSSEDTSPFLHGFAPPIYLGPLTDDEAEAYATGLLSPGGGRPADDMPLAEIREVAGNHPFTLRLVCSRLRSHGDLGRARDEAAADPALTSLFATDLETLAADERDVLRAVAGAAVKPAEVAARLGDASRAAGALYRLEQLGMVRSHADGEITIASSLLAAWLRVH